MAGRRPLKDGVQCKGLVGRADEAANNLLQPGATAAHGCDSLQLHPKAGSADVAVKRQETSRRPLPWHGGVSASLAGRLVLVGISWGAMDGSLILGLNHEIL